MPTPAGRVRLRRGVVARLFSGFPLQPYVTMAVLLFVVGTVFVAQFTAASEVLRDVPAALPVLLFWLVGVTAHATVDADAVRWRYFVPRAVDWAQVQHLRFGTHMVATAGGLVPAPAIYVGSAVDRERALVPAYGCSTASRLEFAAALAGRATARGIPIEVTGTHWADLPAALPPGADVATSRSGRPAARIPQSSARRQTGVFGLALAVCGVLALVGGITGWDAQGENHATLIAVGAVLLVLGGPMSLMLRRR